MVFLRIASLIFLVFTPILSIRLVSLLRLKQKGWNMADIAFPLFAVEFYLISDKAFYHSLLPHLLLALSLLALAIVGLLLYKTRDISYPRFFKIFWRAGFLLTFVLYLALVVSLFILSS